MRLRLPIITGALLLWSGSALAQTQNFDDQPPAPAGDGGQGSLIQMCNEENVRNALQECQGKIREYDNQIREYERRKARKDTDVNARQEQWLRNAQHDLTQYKDACAKIEYGLQQLRAHPETRCDPNSERLKEGE